MRNAETRKKRETPKLGKHQRDDKHRNKKRETSNKKHRNELFKLERFVQLAVIVQLAVVVTMDRSTSVCQYCSIGFANAASYSQHHNIITRSGNSTSCRSFLSSIAAFRSSQVLLTVCTYDGCLMWCFNMLCFVA
jgi:hypothetical protein